MQNYRILRQRYLFYSRDTTFETTPFLYAVGTFIFYFIFSLVMCSHIKYVTFIDFSRADVQLISSLMLKMHEKIIKIGKFVIKIHFETTPFFNLNSFICLFLFY